MYRYLSLAVLVTLLSAPESFATCRTSTGLSRDVSTLKLMANGKPDANANLFDYGVIFEDAGDAACSSTAAVALYKKVMQTYAFGTYTDSVTNSVVDAYQGWLEGANAGLVYATALRLGGMGTLTKPLAALIDQLPYTENLDSSCGFATNRNGVTSYAWSVNNLNSCMDDWAMAAHARGWQSVWWASRFSSNIPVQLAKDAASNALNTSESVCLHPTGTPANPAPSAGPCTATVTDLDNNAAVAVALHGGDSLPYGIGLMSTMASADVALSLINESIPYTTDEVKIAKALYKNADAHTELDWNPQYLYTFKSDCYHFSHGSGGELVRTTDFGCMDTSYGDGRTGGYQPEMFPVRAYYDAKLGGAPAAANYDFSVFVDALFCDDDAYANCRFFNPGRKAVYKTIGYEWVTPANRPALNTATYDYTSTFRTYDNAHYLSATGGGGTDVNAAATAASTHETFSMVDVNGGTLTSGDTVYLQVLNGQYISATNGGGSTVIAQHFTPLTWEAFTIQKMNGSGQIYSGDTVALQVLNGQYISAVNGGGSDTVAMYSPASTWETFTINFTP
ncbi:MAG: hypothetical protein M3Q69_02615 [Acidobacteriota bacterium]|nr:hypothetical protein [Acidobacteriota bacterium]